MLHARPDYQARIVDLMGLIPEEEPVFLLRAQDQLAPAKVREWAEAASVAGCDPIIVRHAHEHADAMLAWQRENGCKLPDMPASNGT